jgi:hypothetical protein
MLKAEKKRLEWEEKFNELFMVAVNEGLRSLAGEAIAKTIRYHLERVLEAEMEELIRKPERLAEGLEKIFGYGAKILETMILEKLYEKLNLNFKEKENYTFTDYIEEAKKHYQKML